MQKELEEIKNGITSFFRETHEIQDKKHDFDLILSRIEESLRQTYASIKRAQKMQFESEQKLLSNYMYSSINMLYSEQNEKLITKLIFRMEFLLKNYNSYIKKQSDLLKNTKNLQKIIAESISKLKKKTLEKFFTEKALSDAKILEIYLLIELFEKISENLLIEYFFNKLPKIREKNRKEFIRKYNYMGKIVKIEI